MYTLVDINTIVYIINKNVVKQQRSYDDMNKSQY